MKIALFFAVCGLFLGGTSYLNYFFDMKDDNRVEEFIEDKIDDSTGFDIDLTRKSSEESNSNTLPILIF